MPVIAPERFGRHRSGSPIASPAAEAIVGPDASLIGRARLGTAAIQAPSLYVAPHAAVAVPIGDWARLAGAIRELLNDEDLRVRIAREALRRATREDADYTAERFQALYSSLAALR